MRPVLRAATVALFPLLGCDDKPDTAFFAEPSAQQIVGVWSGTEEITTEGDLSWNTVYSDYGPGFSFPVIVRFDDDGSFTLTTANFPTSYVRETARSCAGVYRHDSGSLELFPDEQCRALPLSKFTLGRVLRNGITLEARLLSSYASVRVRFRLERDF